jgi:hypothetical protein
MSAAMGSDQLQIKTALRSVIRRAFVCASAVPRQCSFVSRSNSAVAIACTVSILGRLQEMRRE